MIGFNAGFRDFRKVMLMKPLGHPFGLLRMPLGLMQVKNYVAEIVGV
jgi:hypothetical protein